MTNGLRKLQAALSTVLKEDFEDQIRALVETEEWYHEELSREEVFRLWAGRNLQVGRDSAWVYQPIRASERKYLCREVGLSDKDIIGVPPQRLADRILEQVDLPRLPVPAQPTDPQVWEDLLALIRSGQDESGAVRARQAAERLLRIMLHFHAVSAYSEDLLAIIRDPGSLRIPRRLEQVIASEDPKKELAAVLELEGWADLGFLALTLRKLTSRVAKTGSTSSVIGAVTILEASEHDTFTNLAQVLQTYTHDNPSKISDRAAALLEAVVEVKEIVRTLRRRRVAPIAATVIDTRETLTGRAFAIIGSDGRTRVISADSLPKIGSTVLFVATTDVDYATCQWIASPWPDGVYG